MTQQTKQSTAGNLVKKTIRVPLVGNAQQRSTSLDKDQQFINYILETSTNPVTETKKLFLVKRPGISLYSSPSTAAEGRGIWYFNGYVYSVFGNSLYRNTTFVQTLSTSTGMCGAIEFPDYDDFGRMSLFLADGIDAWVIRTNNTIHKVDNYYLKWAQRTTYEEGDRVVPTTDNGYWYVCTDRGETGTTEPTWPTTIGNTVVSGGCTFECAGIYTALAKFQTSHTYVYGDLIIPITESGYWFMCNDGGTSATTEPSWPVTVGETVTSGTCGFICMGEYGGFPTPHIPTPQYMDGYLFLPEQDSNYIYNSNITKWDSWGALSFVGAEAYPDNLVGLARQNNYIVAFGEHSTEFLFNSAKANQLTDFDSPLDRYEALVLQTGCLNINSLFQSEKSLVFIAKSGLGGHSVWRVDGTSAKEISTEYIEKFIDLETPSSTVRGFGLRINGHVLYLINLPTANKTFCYDLEEQFWTEWKYDGNKLPFCAMTDRNGDVLIQHESNGSIYKFNTSTFKDWDADIECVIRLAKQDFETDNRKFYYQTTIVGDSCDDPFYLSWSDDDYTTWSNEKELFLGNRPYFMRSGTSRRRAWKIRHVGNSRVRLEALEVTYSSGIF